MLKLFELHSSALLLAARTGKNPSILVSPFVSPVLGDATEAKK